MKPISIYQIDSFTNEKFKGNPAGVVLDADALSKDQMLVIAREMNNSETAFILSAQGDDHDVWLRYFTPATEVPICGHATIAAHFVRALENQMDSCVVLHKTGAGILPVEIIKKDMSYEIIMTQGKIEFEPPMLPETVLQILNALGLEEKDLDANCPVQIVSTGHSKVIVGIKSRKTLNRLAPDFNALIRISKTINCNGYFIFTFDSGKPDCLTSARMFAPAIGINEDPVTGNGNGPLGAYLIANRLVKHDGKEFHFNGLQSEAILREGIVRVEVTIENNWPVRTRVGGQAVVVFKTQITL